jgi:hypothetical protein
LGGSTVLYPDQTTGMIIEAKSPTNNYGNGLWFDHGGLNAGIGMARKNTSTWGTDLRFYVHPDSVINQRHMIEVGRINPDGNFGINQTNPTEKLDVVGNINVDGTYISLHKNSTDTAASYIFHKKSRGTRASPINIANGDYLGSSRFQGYLNGAYRDFASISTKLIDTPDGNYASTQITLSIDGGGGVTDEVKINSGGITVLNEVTALKVNIQDLAKLNSVHIGGTSDPGDKNLLVDGNATVNGVLFPSQAATASAPAYVLGGVYFDTTLNKLRVGGATGWETVTSI